MHASAQDKAILRDRVRSLLLSPQCQKIDFDFAFSHGYGFNRHKVDGWGLAHVANCLATPVGSGRGIFVEVRQLPPNVEAQYSYAGNRLIFPSVHYGQTQLERRAVVHECVHALRDTLGAKSRINGAAAVPLGRTRGAEEEAEAYVADALFLIYDAATNGWTIDEQTDEVSAAARAIARNIADKPGALVGIGDHAELRKAILASPTYKHMHKNPDFVYVPPPNGVRM